MTAHHRLTKETLASSGKEPLAPSDIAVLRTLAVRLKSLADQLDRPGDGEPGPPAPLVEHYNQHLIAFAEAEYTARSKRRNFVDGELLGEPAWDMLLDLFIQGANQTNVSVTSACVASGVPDTTAIRWLVTLENKGLVQRTSSPRDRRVQLVQLTETGILAITGWLRYRSSLSA